MNCIVEKSPAGFWTCQTCGWVDPKPNSPKPNRNCPNSPNITEAVERLGISPSDVVHWAEALASWTAAGFPTRSQDEVRRILQQHCNEACESFIEGRCKRCGCRVNGSRLAVANKIKMATEHCPAGKW